MSKLKKKELINSSKLMIAVALVAAALLLGWFIGTKVIDGDKTTHTNNNPVSENGAVNDLPNN